jgi:tight adherence protein B
MMLAGGIGLALMLLFVGLDRFLRTDDPAFENRLRRYAVRQGGGADPLADARGSAAVTSAMSDRVGRAIAGRSFAANLQADLARADLKLTAAEFLIIQAVVTVIVVVVGYTITALVFGANILAVPIFGLIGFILPKMWVSRRQSGRLQAFTNQLADTIVLMSNSLRSGMSLLQAMDMVSREGNPPISEEFGRVTREIGLGLSPQDALLHLVRRMKSDDLELLVIAINVQHEVGGNLARILNTIAETIRERVKLKGEINTITSQQRMSGYILALLPVFVGGFLFLASPAYMRPMFAGFPYLFVPIAGGISIFLGFLVMKQIVNIEV